MCINLPAPLESSAQSTSRLLKQYCLARTTVLLLFLRVVLQGPSVLLDDALHALEALYHTRTCPSIDGECCVERALVAKQYCLRRETVLLLPPKDAEKTMLCH